VEVTLVHRDRTQDTGGNQLEAARQAIRSQAAARERAEHLLEEARATIRDLQTKLAHERLAKNEAVQRAEAEAQGAEQGLQAVKAELAGERAARQTAERGLAEAERGRRQAEARLRDLESRQQTPEPSKDEPEVTAQQPRRRGRPPKAKEPEPETAFVEWWKPGWRQRLK